MNTYLVHLEELVRAARRLRKRLKDGDWEAGWLLVLLVQEWAGMRAKMLEHYDPEIAERVQAIASEFVAVLTGRQQESAADEEKRETAKARQARKRRRSEGHA
jgi:hypothetical protein